MTRQSTGPNAGAVAVANSARVAELAAIAERLGVTGPNVPDDAPSVFDHVSPREWPETPLEVDGELDYPSAVRCRAAQAAELATAS